MNGQVCLPTRDLGIYVNWKALFYKFLKNFRKQDGCYTIFSFRRMPFLLSNAGDRNKCPRLGKRFQEKFHSQRNDEELYRSLFFNMLNGVAYCRIQLEGEGPVDFTYLAVNPAFERLTGLREVAGKRASTATPGIWQHDLPLLEIFTRTAHSRETACFEMHVNTLNRWLSVSVFSPKPGDFVWVLENVSERKEQHARIVRLMRIQAVLSGINQIIVRHHDRKLLLEEACRVAVEQGRFRIAWVGILNGECEVLDVAAVRGTDIRAITKCLDRCLIKDAADSGAALYSGKAVFCNDVFEQHLLPKQIRLLAEEYGCRSVCALPLVVDRNHIGIMNLYFDEANFFDKEEVDLLNELSSDISFALEYIEHEEQLNYLAYYDSLTGLPNRTLFFERLSQLLRTSRSESQTVAVLLLNLDRFTFINETYGRNEGDKILKQVAERLQTMLHTSWSAARIGADVFAVAAYDPELGKDVLSRLQQTVFDAFNSTFVVGDTEIRITARMGIALHPDDGNDAAILYQCAETALKEARLTGRRCLYFAPELNAKVAKRLSIERKLRVALQEKQFVIFLQPRVSLVSGRVVGAEALIRWQHPERGLIFPDEFISVAEQAGLIAAIGAWIIDAVCAQQSAWICEGLNVVPIAINISPAQFAHDNVLEVLRGTLSAHNLEARYLELELTESLMIQNPEEASHIMQSLRQCGLRLSLDDFGTGYSSLAYLQRYPFDFVKIDRSFISDIVNNPADAAIATAIIAMAHRLGLAVVAEGVETEEQMQYLQKHGCDEIQGYYFSPPVSIMEFAEILRYGRALDVGVKHSSDRKFLDCKT